MTPINNILTCCDMVIIVPKSGGSGIPIDLLTPLAKGGATGATYFSVVLVGIVPLLGYLLY